jgi:hypothetical protein
MCTYATVKTAIDGSAKGPQSGWFHVTAASARELVTAIQAALDSAPAELTA